MPGFFQTALYDSNHFLDSIRDDVILRASPENSLRLGVGSNTGILITPDNDIIMKGNLVYEEVIVDQLWATITKSNQPHINELAEQLYLKVAGNSYFGSNSWWGYILQGFHIN